MFGATVPSVVSLELRPMVTLALGRLVSAIVNVAVPPASVVLPLMADTVTPAKGVAGDPVGMTPVA